MGELRGPRTYFNQERNIIVTSTLVGTPEEHVAVLLRALADVCAVETAAGTVARIRPVQRALRAHGVGVTSGKAPEARGVEVDPLGIAAFTRDAVAQSDMTQAELARRLGMHPQTLSKALLGKSGGSLGFWSSVFRELGLTMQATYKRTEEDA
jgi:DNA-binding XRE family transcriptional regulator